MRKRWWSILLAMAMCLTMLPVTALAADASGSCGAEGNNLTWTLEDGTLTISGSGEMKKDYGTTKDDGPPWISNRPSITHVVIGEGVTSIGDYAFYLCNSLTSVEIPSSMKTIGEHAFDSSGLEKITFADNAELTTIGASAFRSSDLISIDIPSSVETIGDYAFDSCYDLATVTFADNAQLKSIGDYAFEYSDLMSIEIPASVTSIGDGAFSGCTDLISIDIPSNVTEIGNSAFYNCSELKTVTFADNAQLTTIGASAFEDCEKLKSIEIPASITSIDDFAFEYTHLETVTFAEGSTLKTIGKYAFADSALTRIEIPSSVTSIDEYAFQDCKKLETMVFKGDEQSNAPKIEGNSFAGVSDTKIYYPANNDNWTGVINQSYGGTNLEWIANPLTIQFDVNGGDSEAPENQFVALNNKVEKPADPTRTGYTFKDWYKDAACTTPYNFDDAVTTSFTLYAKWEKNSSSGGSGVVITPTYPPTITKPEGGDVTVSPTSPQQGDTVTITPKPDNGYEVDKVTVTDSNGKEVEVKDNGDGTYSFTQPNGKVTITVTFRATGCPKDSTCPISKFTDSVPTAWYHDGVHYVLDEGLMFGIGDNQFAPNATLTRAELAQILYNKAGKPAVSSLSTFTDVPATAWYAKAIAWAQQNNIVSGIGGNQFAPNQIVTREQIAVMLYNEAGKPTVSGTITGFADAASVSDWAYDAVLWATQHDVVNGALQSNGTRLLHPTSGATRAETAALLQNYYNQ